MTRPIDKVFMANPNRSRISWNDIYQNFVKKQDAADKRYAFWENFILSAFAVAALLFVSVGGYHLVTDFSLFISVVAAFIPVAFCFCALGLLFAFFAPLFAVVVAIAYSALLLILSPFYAVYILFHDPKKSKDS